MSKESADRKFTVLGARGFIGSHLVSYLRDQGWNCDAPSRNFPRVPGDDLGHVVYCIGVTGDFRTRPFDTMQAHVCDLLELLRLGNFTSLLYLSSTRVYAGADATHEDATLKVMPAEAEQLYNLSKLAGESICLNSGRESVRVARLSNVYGFAPHSRNFLDSLIQDAILKGGISLKTSLDSAKDYICVADLVRVLPRIAMEGRDRVYNVASGVNVNNGMLVKLLEETTGCNMEVASDARTIVYPAIDVRRLTTEFNFTAGAVAQLVPDLIARYQALLQR